jgi:DNA-binding beta-propeller fold protein YncE
MMFPHQTALDGTTYWVADTNKNRVLHLGADGTVLTPTITTTLPHGIAVDANFVYVSSGNQIQRYAKDGTGKTVLPATVSLPWNLTLSNGKLYIADGNNGRILILTLSNNATTSFGSTGSCTNCLSAPRSVALDPTSNEIAVADFLNNRVSIWTSS